ncbi:hypothetical protein IMZ48_37095 [Candidatus Bathyarchaeota archaeon]|nr:hypothetical protein [Candidatus Bathyarchaeota archaeon]
MRQDGLVHQSTAAEIKTGTKSKSVGTYLPQLWFGRTPWLIIGQHKEGTFDRIRVIKAADHFGEWESKRQDELQRLVAVLSQLREAVRMDGRSCVAVYEKTSKPPVIAVFALTSDKRALPDDLISGFWDSGDTGSSTTPS